MDGLFQNDTRTDCSKKTHFILADGSGPLIPFAAKVMRSNDALD